MPTWETQGKHRLYHEGDLLFFELHGLFDAVDTQRMLALVALIHQEYGYVLSVFDAHDGLNMSPEARRLTGQHARHDEQRKGATAIIAASFAMRTVAVLILNVARLAGKKPTPVQFFATAEEATIWLQAQRQQLRAAVAGRPGR